MPSLRCIFCGSTYHDYRHCTAVYKLTAQKQAIAGMKQEYAGQSPSIFVGHYGYPNVNVGILNVGQYEDHDDPLKWSREEVPITKIVELRSSLINAHTPKPVTAPRSFNDRLLEMSKEIALARKPADVEIALERKPQFKVAFYQDAAPHGPSVALKSASLAANPSTDERLQAAADDTDLRAGEALTTLFRRGVDEHALTKALSVGTLGLTPQRKLVPTRWAITAVDDTLGKKLIQEIKQYPESDCLAFAGGHLGNTYCILFFDDVWQYELFEQFVPQERRIPPEEIVPETDYEPYTGRTEYASETVGGYYAARIGILEKLRDLKRQSCARRSRTRRCASMTAT